MTLIPWSARIRVACKRFSNAWAISHYGVSREEIWQLFPLKNQDAPSAALN